MHPLSERRKKVRCQKVKTLQLRLSERVLSGGCFRVGIYDIIAAKKKEALKARVCEFQSSQTVESGIKDGVLKCEKRK